MTFPEKLITLRAGRGWSQEKLAQELGVTRQAVGRWERGSGLPDANSLMALARVFDVDVEWLLDEGAGRAEPRRIRRVGLMWYDYAAMAVFAVSLLVSWPLYRYVYGISHLMLMYYALALFRLFMGCCVWFAGAWSFAALICRFAVGTMPPGKVRRTVTVISAVAAILIFAINVIFCVLSAGVIKGELPALLSWVFGPIPMFLQRHQALLLLPGAALSLCAPRQAK